MKQKLITQTNTSVEFKIPNIFSFKRESMKKFESQCDFQDKDSNKIGMIKPMKFLSFIFSLLSKLSIIGDVW